MDTLCGIFQNQALRYGEKIEMLRGKFGGEGEPIDEWRSMSWKDVRDEVMAFGMGLIAIGLDKGDRVAVFSESIPRWIVADQAIQSCGAVGVPLYPTLTDDELAYMTGDSGSRIVIASNQEKAEMALRAKAKGLPVIAVITMGPWKGEKPGGAYTFNEIMEIGRSKGLIEELENRIQDIIPDDVASIIYTSGTTGRQKGAVLTQKNWVSNIHQCSNSTLLRRQKALDNHLTHLCHLPLCHVYGRTSDYHVGALHLGGILVFAESFEKIPQNLLEIRPNVVASIPRFYEKVYDTVHSALSRQKKTYQDIFKWALRLGAQYTDAMSSGKRMPQSALLQFALANVLVFNKIRKMSGMDRLVLAISGGGKLSKEVCVFIRSLGIQLNEGYGLTETSPVINFNEPEFRGFDPHETGSFMNKMIDWTVDLMVTKQAKGKSPYTNAIRSLKLSLAYNTAAYKLQVKPGSVGRPVIWTDEKIADDGEILVKGPQVFKGYWNMPEATKEAFTEDGWFKTGDIGEFDQEGFLTITDRKKELFVTSGGKNIAPHPIELALTVKPYIEQVCLVGDARKYITSLIIPEFSEVKRFAKANNILFNSDKELVERPEIQKLFEKQVEEVNDTLPRYEQIKYFKVLDKSFSVETGELTPTLKLKRRIILEKYKYLIERMYQS
jgi:long-chain acyl-CoA synthetase